MSASVKLNAKLIDSFNRNNAVVYKLVTKQWFETIFVKEKNFAADAVVGSDYVVEVSAWAMNNDSGSIDRGLSYKVVAQL